MPESSSHQPLSVFQRSSQKCSQLVSSKASQQELIESLTTYEHILAALKQNLASKTIVIASQRHIAELSTTVKKYSESDYLINILSKNLDVELSYSEFQRILNEPTRRQWEEQSRRLTTPSYTSRINGLMSTLTYLPVSFYRRYAPTFIQKTVKMFTPDTIDSESKRKLLECLDLCKDQLNQRKSDIDQAIETNLLELIAFLVIDPSETQEEAFLLIKSKFKAISEDELDELHKAASAATAVAQLLEDLVVNLRENTSYLERINTLDQSINQFKLRYDGILVAISNFLAKYIASFFKSSTAKQIDELNTIKSDLQNLKQQLQDNEQRLMSNIEGNQHLPQEVQDSFKGRLKAEIPAPAVELKNHSNRNAFFKNIQEQKQVLDSDLRESPRPTSS
ncbi:hypothetical protein [Legionella yabuuchiae]|uniref:hypothetical protein n=1 Tax=Legionella yabuuchiae TaxID=376727 RepID=UPI00105643F7|nr:hypothetical protein [Legionella yabuuchiae]